MKYLFLFFLLAVDLPALSADKGCAEGEVEEQKGPPKLTDSGAASLDDEAISEMLEFKLGGKHFTLSPDIVKQFSFFKGLVGGSFSEARTKRLGEAYPLTAANLELLLKLLNGSVVTGADESQQLAIIDLADFLGLNNWQPIGSFLTEPSMVNYLLEKNFISRFAGVDFGDYGIAFYFLNQELRYGDRIYWQPQVKGYWVIDRNGSAQYFDEYGMPTGGHLANVRHISWQRQGKGYWVVYRNNSAQYFDEDVMPTGGHLADVSDIYWQPQGKGYWVVYRNNSAQYFGEYGMPRGDLLANVAHVYWQPQGRGCWVVYRNCSAQYFGEDGVPIGGHLASVADIYWQPQGKGYLVRYIDGSAQYFGEDGMPRGDRIARFFRISWQPQGRGYWVVYGNYSAQYFGEDGVPRGDLLADVRSIDWQPQGKGYWVHDWRGSAKYFGANGVPGGLLDNVSDIDWRHQGQGYVVMGKDFARRIFSDSSNLSTEAQLLLKIIDNHWKQNPEDPPILYEAQLNLLPPNVLQFLRQNGLIDELA